jgi:hypothetical protein
MRCGCCSSLLHRPYAASNPKPRQRPSHLPDRHPGQLAAIIRGHSGIEDRLHWIRGLDFGEHRSQVTAEADPQIMASLRNLAILKC